MQKWAMLLAGGLCGTAGRYLLAGAVYRLAGAAFPYGTLAVNTLGCLAAGFFGALSDQKFLFKPETRVFLMVGLLGAFTTFSTLIYESWRLIQDGELLLAGVNLAGSILLGLAALWVGHLVASAL
jgi:CrcB protein